MMAGIPGVGEGVPVENRPRLVSLPFRGQRMYWRWALMTWDHYCSPPYGGSVKTPGKWIVRHSSPDYAITWAVDMCSPPRSLRCG